MAIENPDLRSKTLKSERGSVPLADVLFVINTSALLSFQKKALEQALTKVGQKGPTQETKTQTQIPEPTQLFPHRTAPIEKGTLESSQEDLLGKLEKVFEIDTDSETTGSEKNRIGLVIKTAEAYKELERDLVFLLQKDRPDITIGLDKEKSQDPADLPNDIFEAVKNALGNKSDLELVVKAVLESQGINWDDLLPQERNTIFYDLERQGIHRIRARFEQE